MYNSDRLKRIDDETFSLRISKDKDFRILQLTDLHLGFGMISRKKDKLALEAVTGIINRTKPDFIAQTSINCYIIEDTYIPFCT
mgnify:CR=1 FL=1